MTAPKSTGDNSKTHASKEILTKTTRAANCPASPGQRSTTGPKWAIGTADSRSIRLTPTTCCAPAPRAHGQGANARGADARNLRFCFRATPAISASISAIGRYQPHTASEVLADQYGDCKDKDTLLEALLRAKGFSTSPALVGAGIAPVPEVPSPAMFNHVITTVNLPGGRIWLDSTPMVSPYRYLGAIIRDQKALVVPADGPATLETTPAKWSLSLQGEL